MLTLNFGTIHAWMHGGRIVLFLIIVTVAQGLHAFPYYRSLLKLAMVSSQETWEVEQDHQPREL